MFSKIFGGDSGAGAGSGSSVGTGGGASAGAGAGIDEKVRMAVRETADSISALVPAGKEAEHLRVLGEVVKDGKAAEYQAESETTAAAVVARHRDIPGLEEQFKQLQKQEGEAFGYLQCNPDSYRKLGIGDKDLKGACGVAEGQWAQAVEAARGQSGGCVIS